MKLKKLLKKLKIDFHKFLRNILCHMRNEIFLENETGIFLCDETGKLHTYYPSLEVLMEKSEIRKYDAYYKTYVRTMKVPDGVTGFCDGFFRNGYIEEELELPHSLKTIGTGIFDCMCVFANTYIGRVVIPSSLEMIGTYAFGNSRIGELVYPNKVIKYEYLRQFKGCIIENFIISKEVSDYLCNNEIEPARLLNPLNPPFDVTINKIIVLNEAEL